MHQVSPQGLIVPNQETPAAVSIPSMPKPEPISSEGGGPYGPWMLVKRPPRRKSDLSTKRPTRNNEVKQAGSRFALLEQEEYEENIETSPKKDLVLVIAKVRNPNVGKNSQKDQKGKNSIMGQHNKKDQGRKQVVKKDKAWGSKDTKTMSGKAGLNLNSPPTSSKTTEKDMSKDKQSSEDADQGLKQAPKQQEMDHLLLMKIRGKLMAEKGPNLDLQQVYLEAFKDF
ncbi:hypothetical protein SESBI_21767 [Sesbania bispinosa]|nr:hypothetical protein SESBI_21767 [Sesbania bispinosa]